MPTILQTIEPIVLFHIQDNTNYIQLVNENKRLRHDNEADPFKALNVKNFSENADSSVEDVAEIDGMHKQIALVYYAICWLFELFKKGI